MDAELKAKWVRALRSRKYKQGREALYNETENSYCCLGVLCTVADPEGWERDDCDDWTWRGEKEVLDERGWQKFTLTGEQHNLLIKMNDVDAKSFRVIAQYVEDNL